MAERPMNLFMQASANSGRRKYMRNRKHITKGRLHVDMNETASSDLDDMCIDKEAGNEGSSEEEEEEEEDMQMGQQNNMADPHCSQSLSGIKKRGISYKARGKVDIKRIENTANRQVTFSKRRNGLLKKAFELSVLCDSQLALIIFSATNKLYEFASPNMGSVLQRYQRSLDLLQSEKSATHELEYWRHQASKFMEQVAQMEEKQRILMGENLMGFEIKDLQRIEDQISAGVARIRERKIQLLRDQVERMSKKESLLMEENRILRFQLNGAVLSKEQSMRERRRHCPQQGNQEQGARVSPIETVLQLACPRG